MFRHPSTRQQRFRRHGAVVMLPAVAVAMAAVVVPTSQVQAQAPPPPVTFEFTGRGLTWTVPTGVTQATFDVYGAVGGDLNFNLGPGGSGGRATATLLVTPGDVITIVVGGAGANVDVCQDLPPTGGFNGGGDGGNSVCDGAAGGGASDVRIGGTGLDDRKLVAGGGGGASTAESPCGRHGGGGGGGLVGADGLCGGGEGGNQDGTRGSGLLGQGSAGGDGRPGFFSVVAVVAVVVTPLASPLEQVCQLAAAVQGAGRAGRTLAAIVGVAIRAVEAGQPAAACAVLQRFIVAVQLLVQVGQLTPAQATQFTASATTIRAGLGCT